MAEEKAGSQYMSVQLMAALSWKAQLILLHTMYFVPVLARVQGQLRDQYQDQYQAQSRDQPQKQAAAQRAAQAQVLALVAEPAWAYFVLPAA